MLIPSIICLVSISGHSEVSSTHSEKANSFAFALANKLNFADSKKNELISPISIGMDFTMLLNGTTGKTHQELVKALGWSGSSLKEVNEWYSGLLMQRNADGESQMVYANAIFSRVVTLKPYFMQVMKNFYSAEVGKLPSREADALDKVNGWVNEHTKKRIPRILDQLNPLDCIVLLNAVTFDGTWNERFNAKLTRQGAFNSASGKVECPFMKSSSHEYPYYEDSVAQYLKMGYRGGRYAMLLMLPKDGEAIGQLLRADLFDKVLEKLEAKEGLVSLPKFDFSEGYDLIPPFKKLGVKRPFEFTTDYGNMAPKEDLKVSQAVHKSFIEVNEQGTKAGVATAIVMTRKGSSMPEFRFIADRPFAFALYDTKNGTILFLGVVNKP